MITVPELIAICQRHEACHEALKHLHGCKTIEEAMDHWRAPEWAYWLCRHAHGALPAEARRMAELKACEDSIRRYWLRGDVDDLHPDTIAKLDELGA